MSKVRDLTNRERLYEGISNAALGNTSISIAFAQLCSLHRGMTFRSGSQTAVAAIRPARPQYLRYLTTLGAAQVGRGGHFE
jgi:hypothetical protein